MLGALGSAWTISFRPLAAHWLENQEFGSRVPGQEYSAKPCETLDVGLAPITYLTQKVWSSASKIWRGSQQVGLQPGSRKSSWLCISGLRNHQMCGDFVFI